MRVAGDGILARFGLEVVEQLQDGFLLSEEDRLERLVVGELVPLRLGLGVGVGVGVGVGLGLGLGCRFGHLEP